MKKNLIAISILASFLVVVIHDIVPHHHLDADDIEFISHNHHNENQDTDTGTDSDHHFPFICPIVLATCGNHLSRERRAENDDLPSFSYTVYSERTELFAEFRTLVVGECVAKSPPGSQSRSFSKVFFKTGFKTSTFVPQVVFFGQPMHLLSPTCVRKGIMFYCIFHCRLAGRWLCRLPLRHCQ